MATKKRKYIRIGLGIFWVGVTAWLFYNMQAKGLESIILESNNKVQVQNLSNALLFTPAIDTMGSALIFYPGALVDPKAYAPMARTIAKAGFKTIILKLPYRMAFFESQQENVFQQTLEYIRSDSLNRNWILGGHSRGGKLATIFTQNYSKALSGLLLVGTSHPRELDLSDLTIDVTKIYGSNDGLASEEEVNKFAMNLPPKMHRVRIAGGNHRQFAYYGYQLGDGSADISHKKQQEIMIHAILKQLKRVQALK
ncbi:Predicted hydrolase of the alpha/beta-hydrolase fold [Fodinibius roseus]|uniref:Predicted hydrolase of the alpha/beta-hydrolase fold n=1 Tax=Fodinibius roseus TaxID=1194090 RepID=A0A1M5EHI8_9BACT|nr:alpha/beta hydrolase [Fodinibius roseus]SHF78667.1 Predicted hydrolase of the alpha/beta-hydrolase fold [Fodinibius roseus]